MPLPLTGIVFWDKDADGAFTAGDVPLAGIPILITEDTYLNGYVGVGVTDGGGYYSIGSTGIGPINYHIKAYLSDDWIPTIGQLEFDYNPAPGEYRLFCATPRCTRVASSWLKKVCYVDGQGVTVTFQSKRDIFTCYYPNTTIADYLTLIQAASKGSWIHWFYEKARPYIPCRISP